MTKDLSNILKLLGNQNAGASSKAAQERDWRKELFNQSTQLLNNPDNNSMAGVIGSGIAMYLQGKKLKEAQSDLSYSFDQQQKRNDETRDQIIETFPENERELASKLDLNTLIKLGGQRLKPPTIGAEEHLVDKTMKEPKFKQAYQNKHLITHLMEVADNGNLSPLPGAVQSKSAIEGAVTAAKQNAKNESDVNTAADKGANTVLGKNRATAITNFPAIKDAAEVTLGLLKKISNHPSLSKVTGTPDYFNTARKKFTTGPDVDFLTLLDQMGGRVFLDAYQTLKGGGAISDYEDKKAQLALARLSTAQSEKQFREALSDYEDIIRKAVARAEKATKLGTPEYEIPDDSEIIDSSSNKVIKRSSYDPATGKFTRIK